MLNFFDFEASTFPTYNYFACFIQVLKLTYNHPFQIYRRQQKCVFFMSLIAKNFFCLRCSVLNFIPNKKPLKPPSRQVNFMLS